jgi:TPR repeat protein
MPVQLLVCWQGAKSPAWGRISAQELADKLKTIVWATPETIHLVVQGGCLAGDTRSHECQVQEAAADHDLRATIWHAQALLSRRVRRGDRPKEDRVAETVVVTRGQPCNEEVNMSGPLMRLDVLRRRNCGAPTVAFLTVVLFAPSAGGTDAPKAEPRIDAVDSYTRYHIPAEERPTVEQQALDGSAEAAYRLFFSLDVEQNARLEEKLFWVTIAAENGSVGAQHMLGRYLALTSKDPRLRRRARFWFKRAAESGDPYALDELKEIEATQAH